MNTLKFEVGEEAYFLLIRGQGLIIFELKISKRSRNGNIVVYTTIGYQSPAASIRRRSSFTSAL